LTELPLSAKGYGLARCHAKSGATSGCARVLGMIVVSSGGSPIQSYRLHSVRYLPNRVPWVLGLGIASRSRTVKMVHRVGLRSDAVEGAGDPYVYEYHRFRLIPPNTSGGSGALAANLLASSSHSVAIIGCLPFEGRACDPDDDTVVTVHCVSRECSLPPLERRASSSFRHFSYPRWNPFSSASSLSSSISATNSFDRRSFPPHTAHNHEFYSPKNF
jgi:hypothetical protein